MTQNVFLLFIKYITFDLVGDFLYFPVWWYTQGFKKSIIYSLEKIKDIENILAVRIWIKNLFRPMYGQYDWQGRLISFLMRIFQIIFRVILLIIGSLIISLIPFIWFFLPIFIMFQILLIFSDKVI